MKQLELPFCYTDAEVVLSELIREYEDMSEFERTTSGVLATNDSVVLRRTLRVAERLALFSAIVRDIRRKLEVLDGSV